MTTPPAKIGDICARQNKRLGAYEVQLPGSTARTQACEEDS